MNEEEIKLVVASNIKKAIPELNVADEVAPSLNKKIIEILKQGVERARANGRRTLQARDL
ncbi:hypothetical protein HYW76_00645 [Candidatus Pacearchaeota archaeon]|nr:hypothetical protein [Candidatus Pacearchaeota archaeon]